MMNYLELFALCFSRIPNTYLIASNQFSSYMINFVSSSFIRCKNGTNMNDKIASGK